jgi:hypothetical protein
MKHQGYPWISSIATPKDPWDPWTPGSTICRSLHGLVWIHIADIHHSLGQQHKVVRHGCLEEDFFKIRVQGTWLPDLRIFFKDQSDGSGMLRLCLLFYGCMKPSEN